MLPLRDENPSRTKPLVTVALIAANVAVFAYELALGPRLEQFMMASAFVPARMFGAGPYPGGDLQLAGALLSMFLHGGFAHIGGNMLFLWIFGDNVEDRLGHGGGGRPASPESPRRADETRRVTIPALRE